MHEQSCVQCYHINVHLTVVSVEGFPLPHCKNEFVISTIQIVILVAILSYGSLDHKFSHYRTAHSR